MIEWMARRCFAAGQCQWMKTDFLIKTLMIGMSCCLTQSFNRITKNIKSWFFLRYLVMRVYILDAKNEIFVWTLCYFMKRQKNSSLDRRKSIYCYLCFSISDMAHHHIIPTVYLSTIGVILCLMQIHIIQTAQINQTNIILTSPVWISNQTTPKSDSSF